MVIKQQNLIESDNVLIENLKKYKWLLSKEAYDYLESLLHLEISAINKEFSDDYRETLRKMELYKKIALYNICYRTKYLVENNDMNINISAIEKYDYPIEFGLYGNMHGRNFNCFQFDINEDNPLYIGDVTIYKKNVDEKLRALEMDRLVQLYAQKKNQDNPHAIHDGIVRLQDENGSFWESLRQSELNTIEKKYNALANFNLDTTSKDIMDAQNYLANLILRDINLAEADFSQVSTSGMQRTLTKKYPDISIKENITNL